LLRVAVSTPRSKSLNNPELRFLACCCSAI
jgi:hypothetical protein